MAQKNDENIERGHLGTLWDDDYKFLPYVKQPVADYEMQTWVSQGYDHVKSFTGKMYDNRNPMPEWISRISDAFGLFKQSYTFYKMSTLEIMPPHSDHFRTYAKLNNVNPSDVYRVVLMLEDWKPGHYFELNGIGYTNWKAGDWFKWKGSTPHAAANIGIEDRYTLQVTGLSVYTGQLEELFSFNIPGKHMRSQSSHPFVKYTLLPKINPLGNFNHRAYIYMNNSYIKELDDINHDPQTSRTLNNDGLHFYLYEPICSYLKDATPKYESGTKHTQGFYSEFDSNVNPEDLRAEEFDSIYKYAKRNNLNNVIVHTGDRDADKFYPHYSDRLKLICDDLFLRSQTKIIGLNESPSEDFTKKFICLNWRYTKHRQLLSTFLAGEEGYLSWYFKTDEKTLYDDMYFDVDKWKEKYPEFHQKLMLGIQRIQHTGPYEVDKKALTQININHPHHVNMWPDVPEFKPGVTPALFNSPKNGLQQYYRDIFVDIVNETRFGQPTPNFSEKVFQAIQYLKPFVLVGPPKTLEYVQSFGFRTFHDYWDESYDDELDHGERLAKIFKVIDEILRKPIGELREMYKDMIPILEHNLDVYDRILANPNYKWLT